MSDWLHPGLQWFLIGLICFVAEIVLPGFVIIFFGAGAWITALCIWLGLADAFETQLIIFIVSTVVSLILFRKQGKRYFEGKISGTLTSGEDLDDVRGSRGVAATDIAPGSLEGKVEFRGTLWAAEADVPISRGTAVEILTRDNLTLKVQPLRKGP